MTTDPSDNRFRVFIRSCFVDPQSGASLLAPDWDRVAREAAAQGFDICATLLAAADYLIDNEFPVRNETCTGVLHLVDMARGRCPDDFGVAFQSGEVLLRGFHLAANDDQHGDASATAEDRFARESVRHAAIAVALDPEHVGAQEALAEALYQTGRGDLEVILALLVLADRQSPVSIHAAMLRAFVHIDLEQWDEAAAWFDRAIGSLRDARDDVLLLGQCLDHAGWAYLMGGDVGLAEARFLELLDIVGASNGTIDLQEFALDDRFDIGPYLLDAATDPRLPAVQRRVDALPRTAPE